MCAVLAAIVALSTRMKFGLGFAVVSVVLFSFSYWQISSSLDEAQTDGVDCGGWDPFDPFESLFDIECESNSGDDGVLDWGCSACCLGLIFGFSAGWIFLSALLSLIFGWDLQGKVDVNFVAPPSEPPVEEDEFADLEAELDSLVS